MSQISKEAVAGVWPVELGEAPIARVFPSISATRLGRLLGRAYGLRFPIGFVIHLVTVPLPVMLAVAMYILTRLRRYTLTSTRVRIQHGIRGERGREVLLAELDDVQLVVRPGQEFYRAADLELISAGKVEMTLEGVPVAEAFRHMILAARDAVVQVAKYRRALETTPATGVGS